MSFHRRRGLRSVSSLGLMCQGRPEATDGGNWGPTQQSGRLAHLVRVLADRWNRLPVVRLEVIRKMF